MNKKGFTLIEVLAVIVILGVIMTIAIPNIVATLDRNKREAFVEDAKNMIAIAEYTIRKDTAISLPEKNKSILITLKYLNTNDVKTSPYNKSYDVENSFVLIENKKINDSTYEYKYYAYLVDEGTAINKHSINLVELSELKNSDVKSGTAVTSYTVSDSLTITGYDITNRYIGN